MGACAYGADGGKDRGQGETARPKHGPDSEPGASVTAGGNIQAGQWNATAGGWPLWTTRSSGIPRVRLRVSTRARKLTGRAAEPTAAAIDIQSAETTESGGPASCGAGKKIKCRKRRIAVNAEGSPIAPMWVHPADIQDRDCAPDVVLEMLRKAPKVRKLRTHGVCRAPKLASKLG